MTCTVGRESSRLCLYYGQSGIFQPVPAPSLLTDATNLEDDQYIDKRTVKIEQTKMSGLLYLSSQVKYETQYQMSDRGSLKYLFLKS